MEFTQESLMNEYILETACSRLDPEGIGMGIRLDRTGKTLEALVLDYFFDKKDEDTYSLKPKFLEEYIEMLLDGDLSPSIALEDVIMANEYEFSDDLAYQYEYGDYTEDPDEMDEQIDKFLFEKRMDED